MKEKSQSFKLSVVIPVYNAAKYLSACVSSLERQTLKDIKIVFVDDGSTDESLEILYEFAKRDSRVSVKSLAKNSGTFIARKTAIEEVDTEYVTFLDPDDKLTENACELFVEAFGKTGADIVHGGMIIDNVNDLPQERIDVVAKMVMPKVDHLHDSEILKGLVVDNLINPGLCGKAFKSSLVRDANLKLREGRYRRAQDFMVNFAICCLAKQYVSFESAVYCYGYGNGVFGAKEKDIKYFKTLCTQVDILGPLREFVAKECGDDTFVNKMLEQMEDKFIGGTYGQISSLFIRTVDRKKAWNAFREHVEPLTLIKVLANRFYSRAASFANGISDINGCFTQRKKGKIRCIGFFYHHITPGGVQRVIANQISMFKALGYKVVLILEKEVDESCFDVPKDIEIVYLPIVEQNNENLRQRLDCFATYIKEFSIDLVYYHAFLSPNLLWELLVCKWVYNIPFIVHYHTATCYRPCVKEGYDTWRNNLKILSFSDGVIALSQADKLFLQCNDIPTVYLPNPVVMPIVERTPKKEGCFELIWCARFSREKNPSDPVKILSMVQKIVPNVHLTIVGGGPEIFEKGLQKTIDELNLQDSVCLAGMQKDTTRYLENADVYLHTSNLEGFPVSLIEASAAGLPIVMYSLPWLEIARDNKGIRMVPQSDLHAMATAIVEILENESLRTRMRSAVVKRVKQLSSYGFSKFWLAAFARLSTGRPIVDLPEEELCDVKQLINEFVHCYARRVIEEQSLRQTALARKEKLQESLSSLRKYLKGREELIGRLRLAQKSMTAAEIKEQQELARKLGEMQEALKKAQKAEREVVALTVEVKSQKAARVKNWNERTMYVRKWRAEQEKVKVLKAELAASQETAEAAVDQDELKELRARLVALTEEVKVQKAARVKNWNERTMYVRKWREEQEKVRALQGGKKALSTSAPAAKPTAKPVAREIGAVIAPDGVDITLFEN